MADSAKKPKRSRVTNRRTIFVTLAAFLVFVAFFWRPVINWGTIAVEALNNQFWTVR